MTQSTTGLVEKLLSTRPRMKIRDGLHGTVHELVNPDGRAAANALSTQETTIAELVADVALWKRLAAERSEQMIDLNLDRAAMGVDISRLQEIVARYGNRIAMANAPAEMQQTIDEALAAGLPPTKSRSAL